MKPFLLTFLIISTIITSQGQTPLTPQKTVTSIGEYYGYANSSGELIIPPKYKAAYPFNNGLARVMNDKNQYGFINEKAEVVIPFQFSQANDFYRNTAYGTIKPVGLSFVTTAVTEKYKKEPNLDEVYYKSQSNTASRNVNRSGIINTKGLYVVPLDFKGKSRIEGNFAMIRFTENKKHFSALINEKGELAFGPVEGNIHVGENNIMVTYNNANEINENTYGLSALYDLDGNQLIDTRQGYGGIMETTNPNFLNVYRHVLIAGKVSSKMGIIDLRGKEIIQTLYKHIRWDENLKAFRVLIESDEHDHKGERDIYFYANEKGQCIEIENVPCPATPPAEFDYEAYISKGPKITKDLNATAEIPWLKEANANTLAIDEENKQPVKGNANTGEGPVFADMNGIWVQSPPPAQKGAVFKINKIQNKAFCGDYKKFAGTQKLEGKLKCVHANETGYIFYIDFYNRPSWSKGDQYLHVIKKEKKGRISYKIAVLDGLIDTSFEQQKLMYNKYVQTAELANKGYNSNWWFWSVY